MGRKAKISYEIKFKFIEKYLNGNISQIGIARELGLHPSSIQGSLGVKIVVVEND